MAITQVGGTTASAINGGNVALNLTLIAGLAANDLVIVAFGIGDSDDVDFNMSVVEAGWTELCDLFSNDLQDAHLGVYWKKMGVTPDTAVTGLGQGGTNAACAAAAIAFRGVDTVTPFDVASVTATGLNTYIANPAAITWSTAGAWVVIAGSSAHTNGAVTYTMPAGYTTNARSVGANDTNDITVGLAYNSSPAATEDPGNMSPSGGDVADFAWATLTMALRPASGGGAALTASVNDSVTMSDSATLIFQKVVADTASLADAAVLDFQKVIADNPAIADATALDFQKVIADSVTPSDNVLAETGKEARIDDTVALADAKALDIGPGVNDSVVMSDALALTAEQHPADTLSLADAATASLGFNVTIADTIGGGAPGDPVLVSRPRNYRHDPTPSVQ